MSRIQTSFSWRKSVFATSYIALGIELSMVAQETTYPDVSESSSIPWASSSAIRIPTDSLGIQFSGSFPAVSTADLAPMPAEVQEVAGIPPPPNPNDHPWHPNVPAAYAKIDEPSEAIRGLANSLGNDPVKIFKYVRDKIKTEFQPQACKGAHVTLLVNSGGMADKAALLASLLVASGVPKENVSYQWGVAKIPVISRKGFDMVGLLGLHPHDELPVETVSDGYLESIETHFRSLIPDVLRLFAIDHSIQQVQRQVLGPDGTVIQVQVPVLVSLQRLWVRLRLNGVTYLLDPSFPTREMSQQEELPELGGYNRQEFLDKVGGTTVANGLGVKGLNTQEVRNELSSRWQQMLTGLLGEGRDMTDYLGTFREHNPDVTSLEDLSVYGLPWRIGWNRSDEIQISSQYVYHNSFGAFPRWHVLIMHVYGGGFWNSFLIPALRGERLTFRVGAASQLGDYGMGRLEVGEAQIPGPLPFGVVNSIYGDDLTRIEIAVEGLPRSMNVTHPSGRQDANNGAPNTYPWAGFEVRQDTRHVIHYLNRTSRALVNERLLVLQEYRARGVAPSDWRVQGESLNLLAHSWILQTQLLSDLISGLTGTHTEYAFRIGRAALASKTMVDFFFQRTGELSFSNSGFEQKQNLRFLEGLIRSAMEHGVLEQMNNSATVGMSTAKVIATQNAKASDGVNYVFGTELMHEVIPDSKSPWVIPSHLSGSGDHKVIGYPKGELWRNTLAELVLPSTEGDPFGLAIVPKSGTVSKGTFTGWGTASSSNRGWRMAIGGGGYFGFGGLMASNTAFSPVYLSQVMTTDPGHNTVMPSIQLNSKVNPNSTTFASDDPIDMRTGAYFYEVTDAVLPGAPGLAFERYYSTERRLDKSPRLGFGWTHNLNRFVVDQTEYELALGMGRPEDAAAMLAALAVGGDLMKAAREATLPINSIATQRNYPLRAKAAVTAALVANWAVDQLNDNAVVVVLGKTTLRFLRNPILEGQLNGVETFLSPPGMQHLTLIKEPVSAGSATVRYVLKRRNEGQAVFLKKGSLYRCDHDADSHNNRIRFTYDDNNRLIRVRVVPNGESATDGTLPSFTFGYDTSGRMATVSTSFGVAARFSYASGPILTGVAQRTAGSPARKWSYAYDSANRMWKLTDPNSRIIATNEYDHLSRVIRQHALGYANAAGQTHTWRYAWGGEENIETDPKGSVTRYFFDDQGRGTVVEDATGAASIFVHDREDRVVQELKRDSSGALLSATARDYDPVTGLLMKEEVFDVGNANSTFDGVNVTVSEGQQNAVTEYDYVPESLLLREVTLPKGGKVSTTYYPGTVNVATVTDPLQRVTSYTNYDLRGNAQTITRPGNRVTTTQFDRLSRPTRITYPDAQFTQFEWQNDPWLADGPSATFDQRGRGSVTSVSLTALGGKVVTVKTGTVSSSASGAVVAAPDDFNLSTYDASGNLTIIENRKGARWLTMYDGMGHATGTVGPRGETTTSIYDGRGWLVETFDPFGTRTSYERYTVDRVDAATVHLTGSEPRRVETDYDGLGRVKSVRDPLQRHSHTSYVGSTGGVLSGINPLHHEFRQGYDVEGNRVMLVNRRNGQWKFAFDQGGRPVATQTPNGSLYRQTWAPGRDVLASIQEPSGQTTQFTAYDSMDRLLTKVDPVGTTQYGYDTVGRLVTVIENGQTITRSYNHRDQLMSITNGRGERLDFNYRPDGLLQTVTYPADPPLLGNPNIWTERKQVSYDYDEYGRLRTVVDWKQRTTTYDYDKAGRVRRITLPNGSVRTRVYDDAGQTREIRDFWAESGRLIALQRFDYNGAGEVKSRLGVPFDYGKAPGSFDAIYDAENRLFSANGVVTSHDPDGNLLFAADPLYGGNMALSYNSRNQLLSAAVGGVSGSFTYDAEGHRQSATHAGQTSTFTVNPAAELSQVLVRQVEGGQRTWAVYGLGLLYEVEIESVGEPEFTLVGGDFWVQIAPVTERLRVHHYDQTGNTVAITDGQGRDVLWVQYDAYGAVVHAESPTQADGGAPVRPEVNALADGLQRALAVTPWLYVGEHGVMTDPTGLLHMRARYYHPGLRRFLNADPIQFEGGMNWYGYAGGDPVMMLDPSGLRWEESDANREDIYVITPKGFASQLQNAAMLYEGSTAFQNISFRAASMHGIRWWSGPKCNLFVAEAILRTTTLPMPLIVDPISGKSRFPTAREWQAPNVSIPGFSQPHRNPKVGDVVGNGTHMGIQVYGGVIQASTVTETVYLDSSGRGYGVGRTPQYQYPAATDRGAGQYTRGNLPEQFNYKYEDGRSNNK